MIGPKNRYKLREEREGASLFDTQTCSTVHVCEKDYLDILRYTSEKYSFLFKKGEYGEVVRGFDHFRIASRYTLPKDALSAPSKVYIEITRRCNLNCKNCYNRSSREDSEIPFDKIKSLIDLFAQKGVFEFRITGGEPTSHPKLFEVIKYAHQAGLVVSLSTNCIFSPAIVQKIKDSGVKTIITSLDGDKKYNDSIRGKGTYDVILRNLADLRMDKSLLLKVNMTLDKKNYKMLETVSKVCAEIGVNVINTNPLKLTGRADSRSRKTLSKEQMYAVVKQVSRIRKKYPVKVQTYFDIIDESCSSSKEVVSSLFNKVSCAAGIEVAAVNPAGDVYGCVVSPGSGYGLPVDKKLFVAGNLGSDDFMSIWLDSSRWVAYRDFSVNKCKDCLSCKHYSKSCFGNCIVTSYVHNGRLDAPDPYCFAGLL